MIKSEIVEYVKDAFLPMTLAVPDSVLQKNVERAIRFFNREGVDLRYRQYAYGGTAVLQLDPDVGQVIEVLTDKVVTEVFTAQTLLLGVTILDYDVETISLKSEHLKNLRQFLASKFRWRWLAPNLYCDGQVTGVGSLVVGYLREYSWEDSDDDITGKPLGWISEYATSLTKISEGTVLRKAIIVDAAMDGAQLVSEGKEEIASIQARLIQVRDVVGLFRS